MYLVLSVAFAFAVLEAATRGVNKIQRDFLPVNFAKFLRTPFLQSTCGRLLYTSRKLSYSLPIAEKVCHHSE